MDAGFDILTGLANLTVAIVEGAVELLLMLIELGLHLVIWIASPFVSGERRSMKLSERFRVVFRRVVYASMVLGAVYALVYFIWLRQPLPPPAQEPTKIDKAIKVIEKAKQIKEALLPSKPHP